MGTAGGAGFGSVEGVCEVVRVPPGAALERPADLLIELPHGATEERHYRALRDRLTSPLPADLECFFFVNTDAGAPECASEVARLVAASAGASHRPRTVWIVRSLLPRTFVDCNRVLGADEGRMTAAVPGYVTDEADLDLLRGLHEAYLGIARRAYDEVCGAGGLAIALHTYAPRSVGIDRVDGAIVERLRAAYRPEVYSTWPRRPAVDLITETEDGTRLAPARLATAVRERYRHAGIEPAENATYRLHDGTLGLLHSLRHPGRVLCLEINRELLVEEFRPFAPLAIDARKVSSLADPLAQALSMAD